MVLLNKGGVETTIPTPNVSGSDIPEPFNANDDNVWIDRILRTMCRLSQKRCFYPSEFVLEDDMQSAGAYDNPKTKERALSDEQSPYHKLAIHCLEKLTGLHFLIREIILDAEDNNRQYTVYCRTQLLTDRICFVVTRNPKTLLDINIILRGFQ